MPGGDLPEGLVTANNETVSEEIGNVDRVDLEDVARLWRDYSTSRALLQDGTGERLANFFWRIWSNPAISNSVPGSTIARLFMTISEGGNRVRTTPVPSTRSTSPASRNTTPTPSSPQTVAEPIPAGDTIGVPPLTQSSPQKTAEPVLDVADHSESSTRAPPSLRNDESIPSPAPPSDRSPTHDTGPMSPTSPTSPVDRKLSNGSKKRAAFVAASGARAKTRPSLPRRKTSQGNSSATPDPKRSPSMPTRNSPLRSPPLKQNQTEPTTTTTAPAVPPIEPPPGLPSIPSTTTSFALPSLSWKDVSSPASSHRDPPSTAATSQQPSSWLVDTNFRVKFVENQIRGASSTNLAGLGRSTSTVRFADQLPGRRATSGASDTHAPPAAAPSTGGDGATANAQARPRRGSGAIVDDDDDDEEDIVPLPRTKSQLSMMIEQERRRSGTHELRPSPLSHQVRRGGGDQDDKPSKVDDNDGDDVDDDLLMMARKDGVTKAGDRSSKARGKQRMGPTDSDTFRYQSPPTPPLF